MVLAFQIVTNFIHFINFVPWHDLFTFLMPHTRVVCPCLSSLIPRLVLDLESEPLYFVGKGN